MYLFIESVFTATKVRKKQPISMITFVKDSKETRDITPPFPPPSFQHRHVVQRVRQLRREHQSVESTLADEHCLRLVVRTLYLNRVWGFVLHQGSHVSRLPYPHCPHGRAMLSVVLLSSKDFSWVYSVTTRWKFVTTISCISYICAIVLAELYGALTYFGAKIQNYLSFCHFS